MSRFNGSRNGFGSLDEEMNGLDATMNDFRALQDGQFEYGIEPEPYYYPPEEGRVGKGPYRRHLGPPQGIEPYAPSHQPIYQQTPEIQPMQYEITREHWKEYADIQNPTPVLEEENDWGSTMISGEQLEYDKAKRERLTMRLPDELVTEDPYADYQKTAREMMRGPKQGIHGLGQTHLGPASSPLSVRERKVIVSKMAMQYIKQRLPQVIEFIEKRTPKRPIAALRGLGAEAPKAPEPTFWDKVGASVQKGIEILMPSAITYSAKKMEYKLAQPGGAADLRAQYLPTAPRPPAEKPFYESPLVWIGAGAAALLILPQVL